MLSLSQSNKKSLLLLKGAYEQLPWYLKWFFPKKLSNSLKDMDNNPTMENAWNVCNVFDESIGFLHYLFIKCLKKFSLSNLVYSFEKLSEAGLFFDETAQANFEILAALNYNESNRKKFISDYLDPHLNSMIILKKIGFLSGHEAQSNRDFLAHNKHPRSLSDLLKKMSKQLLLISERSKPSPNATTNFDAIKRHENIPLLVTLLDELKENNLLTYNDVTQTNFAHVVTHQNPNNLVSAFKIVRKKNTENSVNQYEFNIMIEHDFPTCEVAHLLSSLRASSFLTGPDPAYNSSIISKCLKFIFSNAPVESTFSLENLTVEHIQKIIEISDAHTENTGAFLNYINQHLLIKPITEQTEANGSPGISDKLASNSAHYNKLFSPTVPAPDNIRLANEFSVNS